MLAIAFLALIKGVCRCMGTFQSTPTMWCHSVTEAGKLEAAKLGNPKKSQGEPAASVKQSQGRGSGRLGQDGQRRVAQ